MKTIILCAVLLTGCAQLAPLKQSAAEAADAALEASEYTWCRPIMSAWVRRYGADSEKTRAWSAICWPNIALPAPQ